MHSIEIAGLVFGCALAGTVLGMLLQKVLPQSHLTRESREIIGLGTGLIATMAALVLGLLVGAASSNFNEKEQGFEKMATDFILLDRVLAQFGPQAQPAREQLKQVVATMIDHVWPAEGLQGPDVDADAITSQGSALFDALRVLTPGDDAQRALYNKAIEISSELARTRWKLTSKQGDALPRPFLGVLMFWLFVLFTSFGLFAPRNATVMAVLFLCAMSVAAAVALIVDLDQPFEGLLRITSESLREAQSKLGR